MTVRLSELVASLSLATDLGLGLPEEHVLRQTVIATRLGRVAGFDEATVADSYYVSLLAWVGCVSDSHELAYWFDDDRKLRADSYAVDKAGLPMMRLMLSHVALNASRLRRVTMIARFMAGGFRDAVDGLVAHCQTTGDIADRLGLAQVQSALAHAFERWDGQGVPGTVRGEQIHPAMRAVQIADDAEVFATRGGPEAAVHMLRSRRGTEFDPALVDVAVAHAGDVFGDLDRIDAWTSVIEGSTVLDRPMSDAELGDALLVFADYADLKAPAYLGHSRAVAELAARAAQHAGCSPAQVELVRRAGLVHRLGATGVSTAIWNKTTPWTPAEQERVRQVPYFTERILRRQPTLADIGAVAALAFERMDGSGYPRGLTATALPTSARLLAAAAAYQQLTEARPHRGAQDPAQCRAAVLAEVAAGRLDGPAVEAVLAAAGHRTPKRRALVAGLTAREGEVLALLVRGLSNKQIAGQLNITPRTVATHIEHIFTKTGVTTRGGAAMYALRHGLVNASDPADAQTSVEQPM